MKELIKVFIAYAATFISAVSPVLLLIGLALWRGTGAWYEVVAIGLAAVPLGFFGFWFSTMVAGFFLNLWGRKWLESAKEGK